MTARSIPGGRDKPLAYTLSTNEVRDDSVRHNDTHDKDRPAHKGGGRSAAMLGIKHGGLLSGNYSRLWRIHLFPGGDLRVQKTILLT